MKLQTTIYTRAIGRVAPSYLVLEVWDFSEAWVFLGIWILDLGIYLGVGAWNSELFS